MRRLAGFALAFAAAVFLSCSFLPLGWLVWLGLACVLCAGAALLLKKGAVRTRALLLLSGAAAGFLWFCGWSAVFLAPANALAGTAASVSAVALDFPEETAYGIRMEVRLSSGVRTLLYAGGEYAGLEPGDRLEFSARFRPADAVRGEEVFYHTSRGVFLLAYADGELTWVRPRRAPLWTLPVRWSRALTASIRAVFPDDVSGLAAAVILGEKDFLSDQDAAALTRAGLSHTVAVSGMHVGYLSSALLLLCRRRRKLAAALAIPLLVLFALVAGLRPSVVRAVVMQSFLLLAPVLRREADAPTSLSAALLLLLLQNPYAVANTGLQLSFAATAGILLVSGPALERLLDRFLPEEAPSRPRRLLRGAVCFLAGVGAVTLGALLFTTPLSALCFRSVSLSAVLSSLLALWAVSLLFLLGLAAALVGLVHTGAGAAAALLPALCARWVLAVARALGALPFSAVALHSFYYRVWLASVYILITAYALLRKRSPRPVLPVCASLLLLCASVFFTRLSYASGPLTVSALDVGQGSSTALISRGCAALVDCGGSGPANAGNTAADYFQSVGISRLDLLVLTHFDSDHFNGVEQLFHRMEVSAVAIPALEEDPYGRQAGLLRLAEEAGAAVFSVSGLSGTVLGEAGLTLYPPLGGGTTNESGLCVLCSVGNYDALITGDADAAVEAVLVKYFALPDIELLLVGHHGARTSASQTLLEAVKPETAVISCGYNTYGHPSPETLERLERAGIAVYRTDRQGTVTIIADKGGDTYAP